MKKAYLKYIIALLLFGSNGIVASYIQLNSYEIVFMRTLTGCLFLIIILLFSKQKLTLWKDKKQFLYLVISGAAMGASWMCLYEAYNQLGVSVASLAYYCGPVIVMALSPVIFKEKITAAKIIGFVAVIAGMFFVNSAHFTSSGAWTGLIFGVLSAVTYAAMVIFNKKAKDITGLQNAAGQLATSFIVVAVFTLFTNNGAFFAIPRPSIFPLIFLGVVNTGIGCYLYFSSIQKLSAQSVSICGYLEPLSALVFSALFLNERLMAMQIVGAVLILGGAAFGELFRRRKKHLAQ